jgi:hypothetical protein
LDKDGYVDSYSILGNIDGGIIVDKPKDLDHFENHYQAYHLGKKGLEFDSAKEEAIELEKIKDELRKRREKECFAIVDRSQFWYDSLTAEHKIELRQWYDAWLIVTETLIIPDKPDWL